MEIRNKGGNLTVGVSQERIAWYSSKVGCTIEQARRRLEHINRYDILAEKAKICPQCGEPTLEYEGGSYEEGISDWIYCDNENIPKIDGDEEYLGECGFISKVTTKYKPLNPWFGFDELLWDSAEPIEEREKKLGMKWSNYVDKVISEQGKDEKELKKYEEALSQ